MNIEALKIMASEMEMDSLHMDYLMAMCEMQDGTAIVNGLIQTYLETADDVIYWIEACAKHAELEGFRSAVSKLAVGSERVGAQGLAVLAREILWDEKLLSATEMSAACACMKEEFENLRGELALVQLCLKTEL